LSVPARIFRSITKNLVLRDNGHEGPRIKMKKQNSPDTKLPIPRINIMLTLRFDAEGVPQPVVIKVPEASLTHDQRLMLADRPCLIDVCRLWNSNFGTTKLLDLDRNPIRITAKAANWLSLWRAIEVDHQLAEERLLLHRQCALKSGILGHAQAGLAA
jgi:hypothetical protein